MMNNLTQTRPKSVFLVFSKNLPTAYEKEPTFTQTCLFAPISLAYHSQTNHQLTFFIIWGLAVLVVLIWIFFRFR